MDVKNTRWSLGRTMLQIPPEALPAGFTQNWNYAPSPSSAEVWLDRLRALRRRGPFPQGQMVKPIAAPRDCWVLYFVYAPRGVVTRGDLVTMRRIRELGLPLHVVCATATPGVVPESVLAHADAVQWKALGGYDISAYTLGLRAIATHSAGATVFVLNDSVFGPMSDLRPLIQGARWDLTGLTAHSFGGNHVQTYAFILKDVTPARMDALSAVFTDRWSLSWCDFVAAAQEIPLSALAAKTMSVGSYLHAQSPQAGDPTTQHAFELVELGHPFLKRSLLGKMSNFQDVERVAEFVIEQGLIAA